LKILFRLIRNIAVLFLVLIANGCDTIWHSSAQTPAADKPPRILKVAGLQHPLSVAPNRTSGFEHDLIELFAEQNGYKVQWQLYPTASQVEAMVASKQVDMGAARFNLNLVYEGPFLAGPSYEESPLSLVCPHFSSAESDGGSSIFQKLFGKSNHVPSSIKKVYAVEQNLAGNWKSNFFADYPGLELNTVNHEQSFQLLKAMARKRNFCALVEKNEGQFYLRMFPALQSVQDLTPPISLGFLVNDGRTELQQELFAWFQKASHNRQIEHLRDLYFSHLGSLLATDELRLLRDRQDNLKELTPEFKKVAKEFSLPWPLLAAVAYQESHWHNDARSFTGVRGIMMLTKETARGMGVDDRADLQQSLWGGAKYLRWLIDLQPKNLSRRESLLLALATYNVGTAHILDAQKLAEQFGLNPYSWKDLKKVLPLLSKPEYYENLDYGEARGQEPVDYANRVLGFYELLSTPI
jgi:membrane-bound lytic murein transglycosylase F